MAIVSMQKVRVFSASSLTAKIVKALYDFGAVHIARGDVLAPGHALPSFAEISTELVRLRALEKRLNFTNGHAPHKGDLADLVVASKLIPAEKLDAIEQETSKTRSRIADLAQTALELEPFENLSVAPSKLRSEKLDFAYFTLDGEFADLQKALSHLPARALLVTGSNAGTGKPEQYVLLASDKTNAPAILRAAARFSTKAHAIPVTTRDSFAAELADVRVRLEESRTRVSELQAARLAFVTEFGPIIVALRKAFEHQAKLADLPTTFGQSEHLIAVTAFVPTKSVGAFTEKLEKQLHGAVVVETLSMRRHEHAPVKLRNPPIAKPFEFLVKFYSLPGSGEIDPTWAVAIGFPIFFGLIVGDIGYGLLSLLIALFLRANSKPGEFTRTLSGIMTLTGISTILWGFIFAEFFGREDILGFPLHPIIHRASPHGLETLMGLAITVAIAHQAIAFLIGAFEQWNHGHTEHAYAKLAWFIFTLSFFGLIATQLHVVFLALIEPYARAIGAWPLGIFTLLSVVALAKFEGAAGLVEIPGLLSNVFSYLRLMALGVAGVVLAPIINQIPLDPSGIAQNPLHIIPFLIFAVLFAVFHILHLLLATVEGGIQSIRLQYVEFFSKFYKGGGQPFMPLRETDS